MAPLLKEMFVFFLHHAHYQDAILVTIQHRITTLSVAACARENMSGAPGRWTRRARSRARCQCSAPADRPAWLPHLPRTPCRAPHALTRVVYASWWFVNQCRAQAYTAYDSLHQALSCTSTHCPPNSAPAFDSGRRTHQQVHHMRQHHLMHTRACTHSGRSAVTGPGAAPAHWHGALLQQARGGRPGEPRQAGQPEDGVQVRLQPDLRVRVCREQQPSLRHGCAHTPLTAAQRTNHTSRPQAPARAGLLLGQHSLRGRTAWVPRAEGRPEANALLLRSKVAQQPIARYLPPGAGMAHTASETCPSRIRDRPGVHRALHWHAGQARPTVTASILGGMLGLPAATNKRTTMAYDQTRSTASV